VDELQATLLKVAPVGHGEGGLLVFGVPGREGGIDSCGGGLRLAQECRPGEHQRGSELGELLVPVGQRVLALLAVADAAQQGRALRDDLLILAERATVRRMDLAEGEVEEAAALGRRAYYEVEVGRREDDHRDLPEQIHRPVRHAVDADALAKRRAGGWRDGG